MHRASGLFSDDEVRDWLKKWKGVTKEFGDGKLWIRARPKVTEAITYPMLYHAGMPNRIVPDGMYVFVNLAPSEYYADVISIESCGSEQNFTSKRSFYAPSTVSKIVRFDHGWLSDKVSAPKLGPVESPWERFTGTTEYDNIPDTIRVPIRRLRVIYALPRAWANGKKAFDMIRTNQVSNGTEFYVRQQDLKPTNWSNLVTEGFFQRLTNDSLFFYR
jgi:hypothetical protein